MPLLGAHMSIGGGLDMAFDRIKQVRGEAMQIFTKNQLRWRSPTMRRETAARFRKKWEEAGWIPVAAHDSYLVNLASPDPSLGRRSAAALADELRRARALGIPLLIAHPGSYGNGGLEEGLKRCAANLDRAIRLARAADVAVLIETTAGQGTSIGARFEEIAFLLKTSSFGDRLGVCLDTCHIFAAGYDIRTGETYRDTLERFDRVIGLERLQFVHLNDSKQELGSRVDRHEHIGKGKIGLEGFRQLLQDERLAHLPMVLETPKGRDLKEDMENLAVLRRLTRGVSEAVEDLPGGALSRIMAQ